MRTAGLVVGGIGVVGIGIGSFFGLRAIAKNKDATELYCKNGVCHTQEAYDDSQSAQSAAALSNGFFAVGGAALATGIVLLLIAPSRSEHARIVPYATTSELGISLGGSL